MQRRKKILDLAHELKLPGVVRCVDEVMQAATQNSWRAQQIVAEFFKAELTGKTARSIRDQMGAAKFPLSRSLAEFDFIASPVNEDIVRTLHDGDFMGQARNGVRVGGTGTGKTHLVTAIGYQRRQSAPLCWFLQRCGSGQQTGGRASRWPGRPAWRATDPH